MEGQGLVYNVDILGSSVLELLEYCNLSDEVVYRLIPLGWVKPVIRTVYVDDLDRYQLARAETSAILVKLTQLPLVFIDSFSAGQSGRI